MLNHFTSSECTTGATAAGEMQMDGIFTLLIVSSRLIIISDAESSVAPSSLGSKLKSNLTRLVSKDSN